jgi:molybdopterin converting factor subunit 1
MVTVKFFGWAKDIAGCDERHFTATEPQRLEEVWREIAAAIPALAAYTAEFAFAINYEYAGAAAIVRNGDEIAILPPVSGG